jgi:hypothetical protein
MMIAAKYEEVYGPTVEDFVYISDQTYTSEQVNVFFRAIFARRRSLTSFRCVQMLEMELKVLEALEYRVSSTTCYSFMTRFIRAGCPREIQEYVVMVCVD